jgi:hypothetical protein
MFEFVDGYGMISIEMDKKKSNAETLLQVQDLVNNHIKDKYLNCHRNKKGYPNQFISLNHFSDYRLGISNMLAKDYQRVLFDVLHLLTTNGYKLVFDLKYYDIFDDLKKE